MLKLIPSVKYLKILDGYVEKRSLLCICSKCDERVEKAFSDIGFSEEGLKVYVDISADLAHEEYELEINNDIRIKAGDAAGAFYAVQTLKQLFQHNKLPCIYIKDRPDFKYRGFYHDITRGKVPKVETLKELIDRMAYFKLNSLQLYVEHTFKFKELEDVAERFGYITSDELKELDEYCKDRFIDFIPSLSTFGHLYELLNQDKYRHLQVLRDYQPSNNFWHERMDHHTIDPLNPESKEIIGSMIEQYSECFTSEYFNICADETFDLEQVYKDTEYEVGKLYIDFVLETVNQISGLGKKSMMWADILLQYPETVNTLPRDMRYLNWQYGASPSEERIAFFAKLGKEQIVCPGTSSWSRFCENFDKEEQNIVKMADYGYKYGAVGLLNTNWGDFGNPCSLELAMYGLVLGAQKSWTVNIVIDEDFYKRVDFCLYKGEGVIAYLRELSEIHSLVDWNSFCYEYFEYRFGGYKGELSGIKADISEIQQKCMELSERLSNEQRIPKEYKEEMLIASDGICLLAELSAVMSGKAVDRSVCVDKWIEKFSDKWISKNKKSELDRITDMFAYINEKGV